MSRSGSALAELRAQPVDSASTDTPAAPIAASAGRARSSGYRPGIDGLRALAVSLVVAFHAGVPYVTGGFIGVDVFFVISGFLITGLLFRESARTKTISIAGFYARRARRLLPLGALVLVSVVVASRLLLSPLSFRSTSADVIWASLFGSNWHFAAQATDYWASDINKSPVLNYWSLSVEEQFYVILPLLMLTLGWLSHRLRPARSPRGVIAFALIAIFAGSLYLSVTTSQTSASWAYFGLQTRAWELAAGGLLALGIHKIPALPRLVVAAVSWAGILVILGAAAVIDSATPFPGSAALWPAAGTIAILLADRNRARSGAGWLLSSGPVRYVGTISYSWYLWHWPFLIFAGVLAGTAVSGDDGAAGMAGWITATAVAGSFLVAAVTSWLIEQPARHSAWLIARKRRSVLVGLSLVALPVVAAFTVLGPPRSASDGAGLPSVPVVSVSPRDVTTPALIPAGTPVKMRMTPEQARADLSYAPPGCVIAKLDTTAPADPATCAFGDPAGAKTIVLVGDSHARFWLPALDSLARDRHWKLYVWNKMSCGFMDAAVGLGSHGQVNTTCPDWRNQVIARISGLPSVDLLLIARTHMIKGTLLDAQNRPVDKPQEMTALWTAATSRTLAAIGPQVGRIRVLQDVPASDRDVPDCLAESPGSWRDCNFDRAGHIHRDDELTAGEATAFAADPRGGHLDPTNLICPLALCPVVDRFGTIMYQDATHLTATFSRELWPALGTLLDPELGLAGPAAAAPQAKAAAPPAAVRKARARQHRQLARARAHQRRLAKAKAAHKRHKQAARSANTAPAD